MIERDLAARTLDLWAKYPVITLTGPRQSGKTTLAKHVFRNVEYVNLEDPDVHEAARADMRGFLRQHPAPIVFDEIQYAPELLRYIQAEVDRTDKPSQYVLTGSHQPALQSAISQSLAGRTGLLELLPLSISELRRADVEKSRDEWIFSGFMPRLYSSRLKPTELYRDYFRTYVERDVRQLANLRRLAEFETFVRLLAGRVGQLLNINSLANDTGITAVTIKEWLSVLEASYVIRILRPYYRNFGKRLVKAPKVYFTETGLAAYLLGIRSAEQVATHPLMGSLFENMVVMEMTKSMFNRGADADMYFLRTSAGLEADVVVERSGELDLYEIKASSTFHSGMTENIEKIAGFVPDAGRRTVVYSGTGLGSVKGTSIVDYSEIERRMR